MRANRLTSEESKRVAYLNSSSITFDAKVSAMELRQMSLGKGKSISCPSGFGCIPKNKMRAMGRMSKQRTFRRIKETSQSIKGHSRGTAVRVEKNRVMLKSGRLARKISIKYRNDKYVPVIEYPSGATYVKLDSGSVRVLIRPKVQS